MSKNPGDAAVRLRRALRTQLRNGAESVTLSAADANVLLDEVGRLQQANDRLRRQNRRVRKRLQRDGGGTALGADGELLDDATDGPHLADDEDPADGADGDDVVGDPDDDAR